MVSLDGMSVVLSVNVVRSSEDVLVDVGLPLSLNLLGLAVESESVSVVFSLFLMRSFSVKELLSISSGLSGASDLSSGFSGFDGGSVLGVVSDLSFQLSFEVGSRLDISMSLDVEDFLVFNSSREGNRFLVSLSIKSSR